MARRASSLEKTAVGIDRDINSEYDNVKIVADNIDAVKAALTYSETATEQAISARASADEAAISEANSSLSETNAASSESSASTSATNASASETNAANSATTATNEANYSQEWAVNPEDTLVSIAAGGNGIDDYSSMHHANKASASALSASTSETNSSSSASNASTSETNAASSASSASTSESNASTSAANAATSETNASGHASSASTSASNASTSETNASNSAASAASSLSSIETIFDNFDDRYLGSKASDPSLDNDGNPLLAGACYWNTTVQHLRFYNGASWEDPQASAYSSAQAAATSETNAATSASAASSSASAAATSETNASNSASSASTSETNASTFASNASTSASNASTSETNASNSASAAATSASNASISETNASNSATSSSTSATNASNSEDKAQKWAEELEDVEVETGKYSAKHHAEKAAASAASIIGGPVTSVNTQTGVVTLTKSDIGLANVDNTSDAAKPISTAAQAALDGKVDDSQVQTNVPAGAVFTDTTYTVGDGGLSQKNFTTTLKTKLDGIALDANNYVHPTYAGDDINIDTGALTGATVISDLDFNVTTNTSGHVTDANATFATRNLTAANIGAATSAQGSNADTAHSWGNHASAGYLASASYTAADVLAKLKTVDGAGSGIDADSVDGLAASSFIRANANDNVSGHTEWQDGYQARLGNGADLRMWHTGGQNYFDMYNGNITFRDGTTARFTFNKSTGVLNATGGVDQVQDQNGGTMKFWEGTQAQYDALTPNADTTYIVVG